MDGSRRLQWTASARTPFQTCLARECLGPQQTNARPLHRRRIVQLHRDLWAECVAECEAAADGVPEYAKGELVYQHSPRL